MLLLAIIQLNGCSKRHKLLDESTIRPHGVLEISFVIGTCRHLKPSYQTVIWLEQQDGTYFKPLLVSEYLSFGGYLREGICSTWPGKAQWHETSEEELHAVTAATPTVGKHVLRFACMEEAIPPGTYQYVVETHIRESRNLAYRGVITIGEEADEDIAETRDAVAAHPHLRQLISQVAARYYPCEVLHYDIGKSRKMTGGSNQCCGTRVRATHKVLLRPE
jgi:hypothetical protein